MTFKKLFWFWLPPIIWMAVIFPVGNKILSSSFMYKAFFYVTNQLIPNLSYDKIIMSYIVFRKSLHFVEYAVLAYLMYRGFRGGSCYKWKVRWGALAGFLSIGYGLMDEILQSFMPSRNGSLMDFFIDTAGVAFVLGIVYRKKEHPEFPEVPIFLER